MGNQPYEDVAGHTQNTMYHTLQRACYRKRYQTLLDNPGEEKHYRHYKNRERSNVSQTDRKKWVKNLIKIVK